MKKENAIIVDIDGTLSDSTHRQHHAENKEWDQFFAKLGEDPINRMVDGVIDAYAARDYKIILLTGRPGKYRETTKRWLDGDNEVHWNRLFMRPEGDFRKDYEIKEEIYKRDIEPDYDVSLVLEDRDQVVKMWRKLGLECWQVRDGNY